MKERKDRRNWREQRKTKSVLREEGHDVEGSEKRKHKGEGEN